MNATSRLSKFPRPLSGHRGPIFHRHFSRTCDGRYPSGIQARRDSGDGQNRAEGHNKNAVRYCFRTK